MKYSYHRLKRLLQPRRPAAPGTRRAFSIRNWALLLLLLLPFAGNAQEFTEGMGIIGSGVTADAAEANDDFDNINLTMSGDAIGGTSSPANTGSMPADGTTAPSRPVMFFGVSGGGTTAAPVTFQIADINTQNLTDLVLSFKLYGLAAGNSNSAFQVSYSVDGGQSYQNLTYNGASVGTYWTLKKIRLPQAAMGVPNLAVRFVKANGFNRGFRLDDVAVQSRPATLAVNISSVASLSFPDTPVNGSSGPIQFTLTGSDLYGDAVVTAPDGYLVRLAGTTTYAQSFNIAPNTNGDISATVDVLFSPTLAVAPTQPTQVSGQVSVTSPNAATQYVNVTGRATTPIPALTVTPTSLPSFGQVTVGTASTTVQNFTASGQFLQGNVTITPPTGFQIRLTPANPSTATSFSVNPITLTPTNGTLASTQFDVRFAPTAVQQYAANITVTSTNAATQNVQVSGEGTATSGTPTVAVNPGAINFGTVTSSGSASTRTFEISGTDLTDPIALTPSASNILMRSVTQGGSFSSNALTFTPTNGTVSQEVIEVRLGATVAAGNYNEQIDITSPGAAANVVSLTAVNTSGAVSDISVSNPGSNDFIFVTRPNTSSPSQSFLVAGTNLLENLVIEPSGPNAQYFQVSDDNISFGTRLSFAPDAQGNVTQRPVYIRFVPGTAAITVSANIRNSSMPAPARDVSVTGISEPTLRLDRIIGAFADNIVKGTTSAPVDVRLSGFLLNGDVTVRFPVDADDPDRNPSQIPQFEFSLDGGATYVKTTTIVPNGDGNFVSDLKVRYAPTRVGNAAQEMQFRNASFASNNFFALASGQGRASGFSIATEPTVQSIATISRPAGGTTATITFNLSNPPAGTSYGQNRLVIASTTYSQLPVALFPRDKQNFNPGTTLNGAYQFGTGTAIEASSNTYTVFSAASNSFTVSNLDPNQKYYFFAFEFNDDGLLNAENYRVPSNEPLTPLPVELLSFTAQLRNNQVSLNWATASELNNSGFEVQRSHNGQQFTKVLFQAGRGTSSSRATYEAVDGQPLPGLSYYRLKQIDQDGKFAYSPVVVVKNAGLAEATFYPNPTSGKLIVSLPQAQLAEALPVRIMDLTGRLVSVQTLGASGEMDLSSLQAGTYIVTVGTGDQQVTRKVVKN